MQPFTLQGKDFLFMFAVDELTATSDVYHIAI